jgi:outer membrane protein OmpA-like peptidoglycan-associated protein
MKKTMNYFEKLGMPVYNKITSIVILISILFLSSVLKAQEPSIQSLNTENKGNPNRLNRFSLGLKVSHLYDLKYSAFDLLSTGASANDLQGLNGPKTAFDMAAGIDVNYFFSPLFSMDFGYEQGKITGANKTEYYESSVGFYSLGANISLKRSLRAKDYKFVPFLRASISSAQYESERKLISDDFPIGPKLSGSALMYGFGLGARYYINKNWSVYIMSEYNTITTDAWDGYDYGSGRDQMLRSSVGIKYAFGRNKHVDQTLAWQDNRVDHLQARLDEQVNQAVKNINDSVNQTLASYLNRPGSKDSDEDGIVDKFDKCPDVPGLFSNNGCPPVDEMKKLEEKIKSVEAAMAKANDEPSVKTKAESNTNSSVSVVPSPSSSNTGGGKLSEDEKYRLKNELLVEMYPIRFPYNSYQINAESYQHLNTVAVVLRNNPAYKIKLTGYTDGTGSAEYNKKLGKQRADAVATYLESRGIVKERISALGEGKNQPLDDNNSKIGKANNRRVELLLD